MSAFQDFVIEQLEGLGRLRTRRMFGGLGLYLDDAFFAIVWKDALYFKVDESNRGDYERAHMPPFQPFPDQGAGGGYFEVPPGVLERRSELHAWARRSVAVAARKKVRTPRAKTRRSQGKAPRRR